MSEPARRAAAPLPVLPKPTPRPVEPEHETESHARVQAHSPRWFLDIGAGVGLTFLGADKTADRPPPVELVTEAAAFGERGQAFLYDAGWDCDWKQDPAGFGAAVASDCKVAMRTSGFESVPLIILAAGYYVTPRFGVGVAGRFQIGRGEGKLAGVLIGPRVEYLFTQPKPRGLHIGGVFGLALGTIQARPSAVNTSHEQPYATSASTGKIGFGIQLGVRFGYRFNRYLALQLLPNISMGLPHFLIAIDTSAGVVVSY